MANVEVVQSDVVAMVRRCGGTGAKVVRKPLGLVWRAEIYGIGNDKSAAAEAFKIIITAANPLQVEVMMFDRPGAKLLESHNYTRGQGTPSSLWD